MYQTSNTENGEPYYTFKAVYRLLLGLLLLISTACVSTPRTSSDSIESDLMEMIILYENIMPQIFNDEFYFNEHNRKYLDVQFKKVEVMADQISMNLDRNPHYVNQSYSKLDPAIHFGVQPIVEDLTMAVTAYQTGHLESSRSALQNSIRSIVALTNSPAIGDDLSRVQRFANDLTDKNKTAQREVLSAMKYAKYNLLSKEFKFHSHQQSLRAQQINNLPDVRRFHIEGSALHNQLKRAENSRDRAKAMYELGRFYAKYQKLDDRGLATTYLQTCIRVFPASLLAEKCYVALRKAIYSIHSPQLAMGVSLSDSDRKLLNDMKVLSRSKVLSVGMVGGLDNFY